MEAVVVRPGEGELSREIHFPGLCDGSARTDWWCMSFVRDGCAEQCLLMRFDADGWYLLVVGR